MLRWRCVAALADMLRLNVPAEVRQRGVALLAGLTLLAAISLLALVATASMLLQRRMAGNFSDSQQARQAAAAAISQGVEFLFALQPGARLTGCMQDCFPAPLDQLIRSPDSLPARPETEANSWWEAWAAEANVDPLNGSRSSDFGVFGSQPPRFLVQEAYFVDLTGTARIPGAPSLDGIGYYRILGRGTGHGPAAVAVSEAIVAHPWLAPPADDQAASPDGGNCDTFIPWYDCGLMAWRQRR
jgi:Tfp pilus assembly protein PilX